MFERCREYTLGESVGTSVPDHPPLKVYFLRLLSDIVVLFSPVKENCRLVYIQGETKSPLAS